MTMRGSLETLSPEELLQMLSAQNGSGKLTLTSDGAQGLVVFRDGKIIYAASSSVRETFGNILSARGLVTQEQLDDALERQRDADSERRLGAILVEMGVLQQQQLEEIVREQVRKVMSELLPWRRGHFHFEYMNLPDCGEVEIEAGEYLLGEGLPPEHVLAQYASRLAEHADASTSAGTGTVEPAPTFPERVGSLRTVMLELRTPQLTGEIAHRILNYAQRLVKRGVIFKVSRECYTGLWQFGFTPPEGASPDFVRDVRLHSTPVLLLNEALERREMFCGPVAETDANQRMMETLGGGWPTEALVAPVVVGGRVLLVFYGDNLPGQEPIAGLEEFDLVLLHAALAMEKQVLVAKIKYLESRQDEADGTPANAAEV